MGAARRVLDTYTALEEQLAPAQQSSGVAWMWDEEYAEPRMLAALLLDLLGYIPGDEAEATLRRALNFVDPRLRCFAAISLLRRGQEVSRHRLVSVAASPETRIWLYELLRSLNKEELFPREHFTQQAIAESDLVNWLTFPTELGRVPDQIELMKVVSADAGPPHGYLDWYLFRFRTGDTHADASGAWLAGVSGPFLRKDAPTVEGRSDTFSSFEAWDARTPDEHVGDLRQILERWRKAHAGGKMGEDLR